MPCATIWSGWNTASTADRAVASCGWPPTLNCGSGIFAAWAGSRTEQRFFSPCLSSPGRLQRTKPVSCRLGECHAQPEFPGNRGFWGPNCDTMLFSMDGRVGSVFSRVVKTALDRPDDSGATAAIRPSDRAKLTSRHLVAAHFRPKSACNLGRGGPSFGLGMTLERLGQVAVGSRARPPEQL